MSYLAEVRAQISKGDLHKLLQLWEEYCSGDVGDGKELLEILESVRGSDLEQGFGAYVELALPLWKEIQDTTVSGDVLRVIIDLQTTNSAQLAETAFHYLSKKYADQELFKAKIRLVGLRDKKEFRGAVSSYELLTHLDKGKFVYHNGGWGTGEVMDYSLVREELSLEFENVIGTKDLSFRNAFNHLAPLPSDHFLALRFGNPDRLEAEARKDPVAVIRMLLQDLGPKTAAEIKEEMCELVIPTDDWTKWWQGARSKLKRDTTIEMAPNVKSPFRLRDSEVTHAERLKAQVEATDSPVAVIQTVYSFARDFSEISKDPDSKLWLQTTLAELQGLELSLAEKLQLAFLQEMLCPGEASNLSSAALLADETNLIQLIRDIDIVAFKKRVLVTLHETRKDWPERFSEIFFKTSQTTLREYLVKQLSGPEGKDLLQDLLDELVSHPARHPVTFVWYFQKLVDGEQLPYSDPEGIRSFFEALLILCAVVEKETSRRDLTKKIYQLLTRKRFELVRSILDGSSLDYAKEFLLLVSKIQTLTDHDQKIMRSLAEVVHPTLSKGKVEEEEEGPIWTTEEGYLNLQEQLKQLGTVETVENAKEIEEARALGDLRENSEYKFALERRDRIQSQMKLFTEQLNRARVISPGDIQTDEIGIGVCALFVDEGGNETSYTLLGPWDANPEKQILSFQSKLAQAMTGHKVGDSVEIQGQPYTVKEILSVFEVH